MDYLVYSSIHGFEIICDVEYVLYILLGIPFIVIGYV